MKIACPHCKRELDVASEHYGRELQCPYCNGTMMVPVPPMAEILSTDVQGDNEVSRKTADYGWLLLALPAIAALLIFILAPKLELNMLIMTIVTVLTAVIVAVEVSRAKAVSGGHKGSYGALAWFFFMLFGWIITYPLYLFKRRHYGLKNHLLAGIIISILLNYASMNYMARDMMEKVSADLEHIQRELDLLDK